MSAAAIFRDIEAASAALFAGNIYWAPIRHHSPACAFALKHLLADIRPATILIEGPRDCQELIAHCQHKEAKPPLALFSQKGAADALYSAYFPLCDYSPEWVAMRAGAESGAEVQFIDLPFAQRAGDEAGKLDEKIQNLLAERYFLHSKYLQAIARQQNCRDQHESWDRLFEQRPKTRLRDWRAFFSDIFAFCLLARRDYETEVLDASGDSEREAFMAANIRLAVQQAQGPVAVVTGGFHTPALIAACGENGPAQAAALAANANKNQDENSNWLIRYSFDQLDALNGYGAGMPAPAYYQTLWQTLNSAAEDYLEQTAATLLIAIAGDNRAQQLSQSISSADVQAAVVQAKRLAQLRGLSGPGRSEVLDAVQSCFCKDAVTAAGAAAHSFTILADARRVLCGDRLGQTPDSAAQTPLIREAWRRGTQLGLDFAQTQAKTLELQLYDKPKHKRISRFFYLMQWLGSSLAIWQSGPDYNNNHRLGLVREHWRYAWTPQVETELLARLVDGATLEQAALKKLRALEQELQEAGQGRQATTAAGLLIRACTMGLHKHVLTLAASLEQLIAADDHLPSVIACGQQLQTLQHGFSLLDAGRLNIDIAKLIGQSWRCALQLLPRLAELESGKAEEYLPALPALRALGSGQQDDKALYWENLHILLQDRACSPAFRGAALALLFLDGQLCETEITQRLRVFLQPGQPAEFSVGFLRGLLSIARETLWRVPALLERINELIAGWPEAHFLTMLPALRLLFTDLSPKEIDTVAEKLAFLLGAQDKYQLTAEVADFSADELAMTAQLDEFLRRHVDRAGLADWFGHAAG